MEKDPCATCGGTGAIQCSHCGGSGINQKSSLLDEQCRGCRGTGKESCKECGGSGEWVAVTTTAT